MKIKILKSVSVLIGIYVVFYICLFTLAQFRGFIDPNYSSRMEKKYEQYSSEELLKKIQGFHFNLDRFAYRELANRKELRSVDPVLMFLKYPDSSTREEVIRRLHKLDAPQTRKALMEIVEKNKKDYEWSLALSGLAELKHEDAWPYVVALAKSDEAVLKNAAYYLKSFEKKEGIPILEDMKNKVNAEDSVVKRLDLKLIDDAIEHLRSL